MTTCKTSYEEIKERGREIAEIKKSHNEVGKAQGTANVSNERKDCMSTDIVNVYVY